MCKKYYGMVDVIKLVCCIAITYVHCNNLASYDCGFGWYFLSFSVSISVAYFFVASGYFLEKKIVNDIENEKLVTKNYCIRLLWPLIFWDVVNVAIELINAHRHGTGPGDKAGEIIKELLFHPPGAMWYVQALILSVIIWYILRKKIDIKSGIAIGVVMYVIGSFANSSYYMVEGTFIGEAVLKYMEIFDTSRNGLFYGCVFLGLGMYIAKMQFRNNNTLEEDCRRIKKVLIISIITALAAVIGLVIEVVIAAGRNVLDNHTMYYSILILAPSIYIIALCMNKSDNVIYEIVRKYSTGIYYIHVPMIVVVITLFRIFHIDVSYGTVLWITDVILSTLVCTLAMKINNKLINKVMF